MRKKKHCSGINVNNCNILCFALRIVSRSFGALLLSINFSCCYISLLLQLWPSGGLSVVRKFNFVWLLSMRNVGKFFFNIDVASQIENEKNFSFPPFSNFTYTFSTVPRNKRERWWGCGVSFCGWQKAREINTWELVKFNGVWGGEGARKTNKWWQNVCCCFVFVLSKFNSISIPWPSSHWQQKLRFESFCYWILFFSIFIDSSKTSFRFMAT